MLDELHDVSTYHGDRLFGPAAEEPPGFDSYLFDEETKRREKNNVLALPETVGILPIRNAVAFPGTVTPLAIGRRRSKALLADTEPNESIIGLLTQRDPEIDTPSFDHLYATGTAASASCWIKKPP